jgi:hypothetical protein
LPTIRDDGEIRGEVANLRREVRATQKERTDLTLRYNDRLKEYSRKIGIGYIDISDYIIDSKTGLVAGEYLNEDRLNHHLSSPKVAGFWVQEIDRCLSLTAPQ